MHFYLDPITAPSLPWQSFWLLAITIPGLSPMLPSHPYPKMMRCKLRFKFSWLIVPIVTNFLHLPWHGTYHTIESIANTLIQCITKCFHHNAIWPALFLWQLMPYPYPLCLTLPFDAMQQQMHPVSCIFPILPRCSFQSASFTIINDTTLPTLSSTISPTPITPKGNNQLNTFFPSYQWQRT